jgi:hypothetical protein
MAVRGDDPLKIKQRAGHSTFSTTEIYIREAEAVREGFGDVFPTLPACLIDPIGGLDPVGPGPNLGDESSQKQATWSGVDGTRIISVQQHDTAAKQAVPSLPSPAPGSQPAPRRDGSPVESRPVVKPNAEPPTLEVLRRKLDAAIVAEAWDAVKAIRERIIEEERTNVVDLEAERVRRTGSGGR